MGTAVGNSGTGLGVGSATLGTGNAPTTLTTTGSGLLTTDAVSGAVYGGGGGSIGGSAVAIAPAPRGSAANATPLLDQATRRAEQRMQRERAAGAAPRIIGIAPRTNVDRTDEMPDDPIIRY
ncbi:MAG TPA: hypothetical protein VFJ86_02850 [Usitatibacter sp.]|nr:hypothetical protein [Usitatibacter sp.]